ncbi:hypothetical protein [Xenorhabdus lircayensis]|uniref:Uncharacterized protein n=1 Tax=Xenorhabdus lircayensis TaxID=2763499 RepID=A0ABS0U7Q5_9GAMM|nr:hypothetical protein [Xenorhabdus lircayensis]MBI6549919.1 hypothetical protein [Xenorhabdus lircayensis]
MSLETAIEKNNELLEQQNALTGHNNALIERLFSALTNNVVVSSANLENPQLVEKVKQIDKKAKASAKKIIDRTPVDIETLDLETVVALAVLFKTDASDLTADTLAQARAVIDAIGEDRNGQVDALHCALSGVQELKPLTKATILDLCLEMVENWDDIPGITERREFALELLNEGKQTSEPEPEADPQALFTQAEQLILQLAKGGYLKEAKTILNKFGARKLGEVPQDKIPDVIRLTEEALEG